MFGESNGYVRQDRTQGQPCPQSPASGPACRPLSGDKTYRRCGRARRLRRLPAASSSKLDLIRERGRTPFTGQQVAGARARRRTGGAALGGRGAACPTLRSALGAGGTPWGHEVPQLGGQYDPLWGSIDAPLSERRGPQQREDRKRERTACARPKKRPSWYY